MCFERWLSWPLSFPQSCRPVGGGQTALLTLAGETQLTAAEREESFRCAARWTIVQAEHLLTQLAQQLS